MLIASMPPSVAPTLPSATPAPVTIRLQTDRRTYIRGDQVGLKIVITNVAPVRTSISEIAQNAPEWQSEVLLTRPDGSTATCTRPDNGELLSISGMYPSIEPGKELVEPSAGFRPLAKWGCVADAVGKYQLKLRRKFLDFYSGRFFYLTTPPSEIEVLERSAQTR
jgi:hypothetical protein